MDDLTAISSPPLSFFDRFSAKVAKEPETRFSLPYPQTPLLTGRLTPLPLKLTDFPNIKIGLANFAHQSIIPAYGHVESWHAMVRNVNGFYYYLSFSSKGDRAQFIRTTFAHTYLSDGDANDRFGIFLTPQQFSQLAEHIKVIGLEFYSPRFQPLAKKDIADDWVPLSTGLGTKYFFDSRGKVRAVLQGGRLFGFQDSPTAVDSSSHAMILARQNINIDISRFNSQKSEADASAIARQEITRISEQIAASAEIQINLDIDAAETRLTDSSRDEATIEDQLRNQSSSFRFGFERLVRMRTARIKEFCRLPETPLSRQSLALTCGIASSFPEGLLRASSKRAALDPGEREHFSPILRFVWVKGLPFGTANGFYLDDKGGLIHEQITRLILGDHLSDLLTRNSLLRGGMVKFEYDKNGRIQRFRIVGDTMTIVTEGQVRRITLSPIERTNLELLMLNAYLASGSR